MKIWQTKILFLSAILSACPCVEICHSQAPEIPADMVFSSTPMVVSATDAMAFPWLIPGSTTTIKYWPGESQLSERRSVHLLPNAHVMVGVEDFGYASTTMGAYFNLRSQEMILDQRSNWEFVASGVGRIGGRMKEKPRQA